MILETDDGNGNDNKVIMIKMRVHMKIINTHVINTITNLHYHVKKSVSLFKQNTKIQIPRN